MGSKPLTGIGEACQSGEWNICFLCTAPVTPSYGRETEVKQKKRKGNKGLSVGLISRCSMLLLKYLLSNGGNFILERINATDEDRSDGLKFCSRCDLLAEQLLCLHMELEVIQMKMVEKVKEAAEVVVNNSRLYGNNTESKEKFDMLQNMVDSRTPEEKSLGKMAYFLELLHDFQTFVFERDYRQHKVPHVFLRKLSSPSVVAKNKESQMSATLTDANTFADGDQGDLHVVKQEKACLINDVSLLLHNDWDDSDMCDRIDISEEVIKEEVDAKQSNVPFKTLRKKGDTLSRNLKFEKFLRSKPTIKKDKRRTAPLTSSKKRRSSEITDVKTVELSSQEEMRVEELLEISIKESVEERDARIVNDTQQTIFTPAQQLAMRLRKIKLKSAQLGKCRGTPFGVLRGAVFNCEECGATSKSYLGFYTHLLEHESQQDKSHCCPDCFQGFTQKQLMELHVMHICGDLGSKCDICAKSIAPIHMRSHLQSDHSPSTTIYSCDHCQCCFANFISLVNHSEKHFRPVFKCPFCSNPKHFQRISMRRHLIECHNMEGVCKEVFKCEEPNCGEVFYSYFTLFKHREVFHTKKWACPECGILLTGQPSLDAHIQKTHRKEKRFVCDLCPSAYLHQTGLDIHKMNAHGAPKFKCDLCDKEVTTKFYLDIHRKKYHGIGNLTCWTCEVCAMTFYKPGVYKNHMLTHADVKSHVCETCGFATKTRFSLSQHLRIHNDVKPFQCPHCNKAFKLQRYLTDHIRIHTKERPFICDFCGSSFNQRSALNLHKKKQHAHCPT